MENYVNLTNLQAKLEDLLFSVRWINTDHKDTSLNVEDYANLENGLKVLKDEITSLLTINTNETLVQDQIQNLYEANHIKEARLKIFIEIMKIILTDKKEKKEDFTDLELQAVKELTNDCMLELYKVKL